MCASGFCVWWIFPPGIPSRPRWLKRAGRGFFWRRRRQVIRDLWLSPPEWQLSSITAFIMTQTGKLQLSLWHKSPSPQQCGNNLPSSHGWIRVIYCCSSSVRVCLCGVWPIMVPNGIMCFPRGHCQTGHCRQPHVVVIWHLLLMLALLVTPIETTTGRGAGQELMDLLKLEITFIAGWIYRQQGPPSLSVCKGQLQRILLSLLAGPQNNPQHRPWLNIQNIRVISLTPSPHCYHVASKCFSLM